MKEERKNEVVEILLRGFLQDDGETLEEGNVGLDTLRVGENRSVEQKNRERFSPVAYKSKSAAWVHLFGNYFGIGDYASVF